MSGDEIVLPFSEAGQGDAVVLLDWTPWDTTALRDALAIHYRVISIEPPEEAQSARSVSQAGRAIEGIAGALGLESYSVVGVSLGANVALAHGLQRNESVASLVLVSPTALAPVSAVRWETPKLALSAMLAHPDDPAQKPPGQRRTAALAAIAQGWQSDQSAGSMLQETIHCAMLVVYGQEDRLATRNAGWVWKRQAPNCTLCYVYDAGHAISVDRPQALAGLVLDFLERRETFVVENRSWMISP